MKSYPAISVIIPTYNAEDYLADAVSSVLAQRYPNLECIVVDDGSTDRTAEVLARFDVNVIKQENSGVSAARNRGIAEATGDFVTFLDSDDVWLPGKLAKQVNAAGPPALAPGLVYCGMFETDDSLSVLRERPAPVDAVALRNTLLMEPPVVSVAQTGLMPRWIIESIGGFDTSLTTSADTDMAVRIGLRYDLVAVHEPLVLYRTHPSQMSRSVEAMEHDMEIVLDKAFSSPALPSDFRRLRRRAYANLRLAVAGARIADGAGLAGAREIVRAFAMHPARTATVAMRRLRLGPAVERS